LNRIDILIAVDVIGALAAGSLQGNVYLVDTNQYLGSWQEGQSPLNTVCQDGQLLTWSVVAVDAASQVAIEAFSGQMVEQKACIPSPDPFAGDGVWNARVQSQGRYASFPYNVTLSMSGSTLTFASYLKVV
jgi:hypothetical protein